MEMVVVYQCFRAEPDTGFRGLVARRELLPFIPLGTALELTDPTSCTTNQVNEYRGDTDGNSLHSPR